MTQTLAKFCADHKKEFKKMGNVLLKLAGRGFAGIIMFYMVGIVLNAFLMKAILGIDTTEHAIWSLEGFLFAIFAGLAGIATLFAVKYCADKKN